MSTDQILFEHYDGVVDSPEAVSKLRKFILDLAVRGRLVEQDPDDEPASELLVRIAAIREKLSKSGLIKKINTLPHVESSPYDVPTNWQWTRIRDVTSDRGQIVPETDFTFIDVSAIDKEEGVVAEPKVMLPENAPSRARKLAKKNDVIYSCVRPYLLNVAIIDRDFDPKPIVSTAFAVLNGYNLVSPHYLWIALRSPFMIECVKSNQRGQAYPAINDSDFAKLPFPLPPLTEQCRIVAKVDELMEQCDRLDEKFKEREDHRKRFTKASFGSLTKSGLDEGEFKIRGGFIVKNFDRLAVDVDQIKKLRQLILDLAVRGRLVEQDSNNEPAEELFDRISGEKQKLTETGAIKKQGIIPENMNAIPYEIPNTWKWVALGEFAAIIGGGTPRTSNPENFASPGTGIAWITPADLGRQSNLYVSKGARDITIKGLSTSSARLVPNGTVLFSCRAPIGYVAIAENQVSTNQGIKSLIPYVRDCSRFILVVLTCFASDIDASAPGTTYNEISGKLLARVAFPLPPITEQHRIVAKVDELFTVCTELESSLHLRARFNAKLLDTTIHGV